MKALDSIQNEEFKEKILNDYCKSSGEEETEIDVNSFLDFLIDINMLPNRHRFQYLVIKKYQVLKDKGVRKTDAVYQLADEFDVHENTIWNIFKHSKIILFEK